MPHPSKKPCPYQDKKELEAAIVEHRGVARLAIHLGVSEGVVRRWCLAMGARTNSGASGGGGAKPCPYEDAAAFEADLKQLGSIHDIATKHGVTWGLAKKWARALGVEQRGQGGNAPATILPELSDGELEAMTAALGKERCARILNVSVTKLRQELKARGLAVNPGVSPKTAMLARRVRELESERAVAEELMDEIRTAAALASAVPPPKMPAVKRKPERDGEVDIVLHVSDKQYGEVVHEEDTPGGRYSPEIYEEERLPRYVDAVEALLENASYANKIRTVWIAQGGDFVEGMGVFRGQEYHLALDVGSQVVRLAQVWSTAVAHLASYAKSLGAERVAVVSVVGNHGVPGGRQGGALPPTTNFDYLCYESVRHQLANMPDNGGVDWYDPDARRAVYFETAGGIILLTHGDQDRGGGLVGAPVVTGLKNDLQVRLSTGVQHYLHLKGHYHRPTQITVGADSMTIWSGAWIGTNNLSIGRGGASAPSQNMHVLHPEYGLIATHRIKLSESVESVPLVIQ